MIQRIQSLFLFLASGGFFGEFITNFATSSNPISSLMADNVYDVKDSPILMALAILGGLLALGAIFLYNNRSVQQKLATLILILAILVPAVAFFLLYNDTNANIPTATIQNGLGTFLPIVSIIGSALAMRFIKKDDKLVRSMDRLR